MPPHTPFVSSMMCGAGAEVGTPSKPWLPDGYRSEALVLRADPVSCADLKLTCKWIGIFAGASRGGVWIFTSLKKMVGFCRCTKGEGVIHNL